MRTIDYQTLRQKIDRRDEFLLVNTLPRDEFSKEHIQGSVNIPVEEEDFASQVEKKTGSKDHEVVVYCSGEGCTASRKAGEALTKAGFTNVRLYEGGMKEWNRNKKRKAA